MSTGFEQWITTFVIAAPPFHGSVGAADELVCLVVPLFVAIVLWIVSRKPAADAAEGGDDPANVAEEEGNK